MYQRKRSTRITRRAKTRKGCHSETYLKIVYGKTVNNITETAIAIEDAPAKNVSMNSDWSW